MTRAKKSRSLKRIHNVKTGSISRLKRQAREDGADRQTGKRVKGRKVLSVYEKFLQENPEARERSKEKPVSKPKPEEAQANAKSDDAKANREREKSLLDKLDSKDLKDIY